MADEKKIELSELLDRLTVAGELGTGSALFRGVAVSRSETALHLGTDGGIVEIPLSEIEEVSAIGGHPNAVEVAVKDASNVRAIRIEPGDGGEASNDVMALLSAGSGGGTIPSGPYPTGTKSTRSFRVRQNDWREVVIDDWRSALL